MGTCVLHSPSCGISGQKNWVQVWTGAGKARQGQPLPGIFSSPTCSLFQEGLPVLDGLVNMLLAVHNLIIQSLRGGGKKAQTQKPPWKRPEGFVKDQSM